MVITLSGWAHPSPKVSKGLMRTSSGDWPNGSLNCLLTTHMAFPAKNESRVTSSSYVQRSVHLLRATSRSRFQGTNDSRVCFISRSEPTETAHRTPGLRREASRSASGSLTETHKLWVIGGGKRGPLRSLKDLAKPMGLAQTGLPPKNK